VRAANIDPVPKSVASHRRVRRRRGRISVLALALGITVVIGGTAVGIVPQLRNAPASAAVAPDAKEPASIETASLAAITVPKTKPKIEALTSSVAEKAKKADTPALPPGSGTGYRIVFDQSEQRVWLVGSDNLVDRTYLVSGSRFNNLHPGTFSVLSRSRYATSFDFSGRLEYFVHFTTGFSAPIGFHAVPRDNAGHLEQTKAQLGTPLSAGCVRQWLPDAIALWNFAPVGTKVVVTA
jgi:L,D-transpeptidase-like protein